MKEGTIKLFEQTVPNGTTRELYWRPAWDKRQAPKGNFGIHGVEIEFVLRRGKCAASWMLMLPWYLEENIRELEAKHGQFSAYYYDGLGELGVHAPRAQYEGHDMATDKCEYTGGDCYYSGSGLGAKDLFYAACADGKAIWAKLEGMLAEVEEGLTQAGEAKP